MDPHAYVALFLAFLTPCMFVCSRAVWRSEE